MKWKPDMKNVFQENDPRIVNIAGKTLEKYDLDVENVAFIQHSENITFRVTSSGKSYLLRLHLPLTPGMRPHGADPNIIRSEMVWLNSLRRNRLPVPRPVRNRAGEFVTRVTGADRKPVNGTVLEWLEGEVYTRDLENEQTVAQIGTLAGKIHSHSSQWRLPPAFERPAHNPYYFIKIVDSLKPAVDDGRIDYYDFRTLQTSIQELSWFLQPIRKTRKSFGLIHGDLHRGNFLYHDDEISLIDFSLCAFGYFMYDLGTCLSNIQPSLHPVFLSNYSRFFPLPKNYERLIEGFFIASYAMTFSFWLDNPEAQEALAQRVPYIAREYASKFNRDERFWFQN
jgi:Ser/Thr protein kinase RdoA (MazF antagonist)